MKLCAECRSKPWPYLIAVFISGFVSFLTWLALAYKEASPLLSAWITVLTFAAVLTALVAYMVACMRRHCDHDGHDHNQVHG